MGSTRALRCGAAALLAAALMSCGSAPSNASAAVTATPNPPPTTSPPLTTTTLPREATTTTEMFRDMAMARPRATLTPDWSAASGSPSVRIQVADTLAFVSRAEPGVLHEDGSIYDPLPPEEAGAH